MGNCHPYMPLDEPALNKHNQHFRERIFGELKQHKHVQELFMATKSNIRFIARMLHSYRPTILLLEIIDF